MHDGMVIKLTVFSWKLFFCLTKTRPPKYFSENVEKFCVFMCEPESAVDVRSGEGFHVNSS